MTLHPNTRLVITAAAEGMLTLPDEALSTWRALAALKQVRRDMKAGVAPTDLIAGARSRAADEVLDILGRGEPLPEDFATKTYERMRDIEIQQAAGAALHDAQQRGEATLLTLITTNADDAIRSLRPQLAELMAEVADALDIIGNHDRTAMLRAPAPVRTAYLSIEDTVPRYQRIRSLHHALLNGESQIRPDTLTLFAEVANLPEVWPDWHANDLHLAPWPANTFDRLIWMAETDGVQPWLPTRDELDRAQQEARNIRSATIADEQPPGVNGAHVMLHNSRPTDPMDAPSLAKLGRRPPRLRSA